MEETQIKRCMLDLLINSRLLSGCGIHIHAIQHTPPWWFPQEVEAQCCNTQQLSTSAANVPTPVTHMMQEMRQQTLHVRLNPIARRYSMILHRPPRACPS